MAAGFRPTRPPQPGVVVAKYGVAKWTVAADVPRAIGGTMAAMDINPDAKALEEAFFAEENARLLRELRRRSGARA